MAQTIRLFEELRVDVLQGLKRALLRRGTLPVPDEHRPQRRSKTRHYKQDSSATAGDTTEEVMPTEAPAETREESTSKDKKNKDVNEAEEGPEKTIELAERTYDILFETNTIFPFTLVPDTVTLDREKLTIAERFFWRVAEITSVPVSEILSCKVDVGPFFGSIHLVFSFFADNQRTVKFLTRTDAIELQRMLHGYIIVHKRKIDTTHMNIEELKVLLKEIGQGVTD